jgi:hypothetical protein
MRAASFKSLYQKRPSQSMQLRNVAWRGAPDNGMVRRLPMLIVAA